MKTNNKVESLQIQLQQAIAKEILEALEILDPNCILAGGAPRDWYLGKPAKDLDFYFQGLSGSTLNKVIRQLSKVLGVPEGSFVHLCGTQNPLSDGDSTHRKGEYSRLKNLVRVIELEYLGVKVQFMEMSEPTFGIVEEFSCDICQFWWKGGEVIGTLGAKKAVKEKVITFGEGYNVGQKHVDKMMSRFPDYNFNFQTEFKLKEIIYQSNYHGIPAHWVVQYYQGSTLLCEYFSSEEEAKAFVNQGFKDLVEEEVRDYDFHFRTKECF